MNLLRDSIVEYVYSESSKKGTFIFVLPDYPAKLLFDIGVALEDKYIDCQDRKIDFKYGVAYNLGQKWLGEDNNNAELYVRKFKNKGWYDETTSLTKLRNTPLKDKYDSLVILLAGYESVEDQASLKDFFKLDQLFVWEKCLEKSFQTWIESKMERYHNLEDHPEIFQQICTLFKDILKHGLGDLISISDYLDEMNFAEKIDMEDVHTHILENLGKFTLPNLIGIKKTTKRKNLRSYFKLAQKFFNYDDFVNEVARKRHLKQLNDYLNEFSNKSNSEHNEDKDFLGGYNSIKELENDLVDYIENNCQSAKKKLMTADFVYIKDVIFKNRGSTPPRKTPVQIKGFPPEIFLRALWMTLRDGKKEFAKKIAYGSSITSLEVESKIFTSNFVTGDDIEEISSSNKKNYLIERGKEYLTIALGGIDKYLEERLRIDINKNGENIPIQIRLSPERNNDIKYENRNNTVTRLEFRVKVSHDDGTKYWQDFRWQVDATHQYNILINFFRKLYSELTEMKNYVFPVFSIPYMPEIFLAKDAEDLNIILDIILKRDHFEVFDLLDELDSIDKDEVSKINELSRIYQKFVKNCTEKGFIFALHNKYRDLEKAFRETYQNFLKNSNKFSNGHLLMKAFTCVGNLSEESFPSWRRKKYLDNALVTPLHPALLELMYHQHHYLCDSFLVMIKNALIEIKSDLFHIGNWNRIVGHSEIKWPIYGLLCNPERKLSPKMKSYNYFHVVGECFDEPSFMSKRLLINEEDFDEEIEDSEMFYVTQTSEHVTQTLHDYCELYLFANDGISISAYCGKEIQPLIAGLDVFLKKHLSERNEENERQENQTYSMNLTIYADSYSDGSIQNWIREWQRRWETDETNSRHKHYKNCIISVKYKVFSSKNENKELEKLLINDKNDIMFFMEFLSEDYGRFCGISTNWPQNDDFSGKFPVLEKTISPIADDTNMYKREKIISNKRFNLSTLHGEILAYIYTESPPNEAEENCIINVSDFEPWKGVINTAHENNAWVVCVDPSIDKRQIAFSDVKNKPKEIIGFSSGVGPIGENNVTISTSKYSLVDVEKRMASVVETILPIVDREGCDTIANCLLDYAKKITGGYSLIKATGTDRFVRELIGNSLVRKLLIKEESYFCDELVSLDGFLHWFGNREKRPDLLRIKAQIIDGIFNIDLQLIECKVAGENPNLLQAARKQVESGLDQLVAAFKPRQKGSTHGIEFDHNPDQRYWWMQLHRLIASNGFIKPANRDKTIEALELLSEGWFKISWDAAIVAIWNNIDNAEMKIVDSWKYKFDNQELFISVCTAGTEFIKNVCINDFQFPLFSKEAVKIAFDCGLKSTDASELLPDGNNNDDIIDEVEEIDEVDEVDKVDKVDEVDEVDDSVEPVGIIRARIPLGSGTRGGREICWEFGHPKLENRHLIIFGASGTGKTYAIQTILLELAKRGINNLIVDYTNGFTENQLENIFVQKLKPKQHIVRNAPMPINPFIMRDDIIDGQRLKASEVNVAQRVVGIFNSVYNLGAQQQSALYLAIIEGLKQYSDKMNLKRLIEILGDPDPADKTRASSSFSLRGKIQPFVDINPFKSGGESNWEEMFRDQEARCHILQLVGFMKDSARLITEFSLTDLYWYYRASGKEDEPKVIVLDEMQNLNHNLESPLGQILTEGRKFGLSLILATQTLSGFEKEQRDRLFQASHKLFFKPADTELRSFAQIISDSTGGNVDVWIENLRSLERGECYSLGAIENQMTNEFHTNKPFKIKIQDLESRI